MIPNGKLVQCLRAVDHGSVEDCFMQSPLYGRAADRIEALEAEVAAAHEAGYELAKKEALQSGWHLRRYDLAKRDDNVGKP